METSDILGLFTSPEQYQLNQDTAARERALSYSKLDPRAKASYGFFRAGQQLGGAIGGALGGQDPQLKMISMRQQLASQLNPNDPESYMKVAEIAAQSGDQQFAVLVADAGRKAMSEYALIQQRNRERQGADPFQQLLRTGKFTPASLAKYQKSQNVEDLREIETEAKTPAKIQEAERVALGKGFARGTKEFDDAVNSYLERPERPEPRPSVGSDREAISLDDFDKNYYDLTPAQRNVVNKKLDAKRLEEAKATASTSGVDKFKDIPDLRAKIVGVVDPFRKAVNATDMALESLNLSITENNFSGFNAARVQLAKALSGGDLSQKEIAAAGGDPSILGGLIDITSTAFTGTPSFDTQTKIKNTINAIRKVALKKGRDEIDVQRNIAKRSNFNDADFEAASDIPEFRPRNKKPPAGVKPFDAEKEKRYQEFKAKQSGVTQ
jgi:hypothetical protein